MQLTIVGCGDAFGTEGRLQSCYLIESAGRRVLLDCGATAQIGLNRMKFDANTIDTIFISHLHGDHFAGLIWIVMSAQYLTKRTAPLRVVGPPTIERRYTAAAEALFPGMTAVERGFELTFVEIGQDKPYRDADFTVTAREVSHPADAPSHALRLTAGGKTLGFSGDTEWVEALVTIADGADLFMTECCARDRKVRYHMSWSVLEQQLPRLKAKQILLTHMNADMLAHAPRVAGDRIIVAEDGLRITL